MILKEIEEMITIMDGDEEFVEFKKNPIRQKIIIIFNIFYFCIYYILINLLLLNKYKTYLFLIVNIAINKKISLNVNIYIQSKKLLLKF